MICLDMSVLFVRQAANPYVTVQLLLSRMSLSFSLDFLVRPSSALGRCTIRLHGRLNSYILFQVQLVYAPRRPGDPGSGDEL